MSVTGKDLLALGLPPGKNFGAALAEVNRLALSGAALETFVRAMMPPPVLPLQEAPGFALHLDAETPEEIANREAVVRSMQVLMRTPTVRAGAVMPDACPAGAEGTIPVGGVVVAERAIHPGMHSADICCSLMLTEFDDAEPAAVMEAVHATTHFGAGGREAGRRFALPEALRAGFAANAFLKDGRIAAMAETHLGTQGDGNHFAFVGRSSVTGKTCLVTHHGSRGVGALLYEKGMKAAEKLRVQRSPRTLPVNAWLEAGSDEGRAYWEALQLVRRWTKLNHEVLHGATLETVAAGLVRRIWNEHNFVFRKGDLFYHAKGATPVDPAFLPDSDGVQIVPMNMAEPVLLVKAGRAPGALGFAPHGAGRNWSRRQHLRRLGAHDEGEVFARETKGLDVRFYSGHADLAELPSAYKRAAEVRRQMAAHDLAEVVEEILPYGAIMAGDWERDAPWRKRLAAREAAKLAPSGAGGVK
jgi:RNA-splicing ligase RtcB